MGTPIELIAETAKLVGDILNHVRYQRLVSGSETLSNTSQMEQWTKLDDLIWKLEEQQRYLEYFRMLTAVEAYKNIDMTEILQQIEEIKELLETINGE